MVENKIILVALIKRFYESKHFVNQKNVMWTTKFNFKTKMFQAKIVASRRGHLRMTLTLELILGVI